MKTNGTIYDFDQIIGENLNFKKIINLSKRIAGKNSSTLLYGETGTGKELFAQSIHNASSRAEGSFVAVNCAAIPDTLIESVLFGTVSGAFTGAKNTLGLLHQANQGTIFLDEVNSMNLDSQAKLLRFLQEKTIRSVGDNRVQHIDCRVISAMNKDIESEIHNHKIREDLYYRLSAVTIHIPALKDRLDDILVLSRHFIHKYNLDCETKIEDIDPHLLNAFHHYSWPGNIRELEHVIESALNMVDTEDCLLNERHLSGYLYKKIFGDSVAPPPISSPIVTPVSPEPIMDHRSLHVILDETERKIILDRLILCGGNISQTAKDLGIFRQALQYRMKKYTIEESEYLTPISPT